MKTLNEIIRENNEFMMHHSAFNADFHGRMTEEEMPHCETVTVNDLGLNPCAMPAEVVTY